MFVLALGGPLALVAFRHFGARVSTSLSQPVALPAAANTAGARSRPLPWLLAGLVVAVALAASPNYQWQSVRESPFAGDFLQEWLGGRLLLAGERERFYDTAHAQQVQHDPAVVGFAWDENQYLPLVYPPFWYAAVSPLALLPFHAAAWLWAGLMIGSLAASVLLLQRAEGALNLFSENVTRLARHAACWLPLLCVLFTPVLESLTSGQKGTLCLLLFAATYLLLVRGKSFTAGMVFGLLLFKPQLALIVGLALLAKRQWRFTAGAGATAAALALVSLALGRAMCLDYAAFALGTADYAQTAGYDLEKSHCLAGFFALLFGGAGMASRTATWIAAAAVLVLVARSLRGPLEPGTPRFDRQFSGLVVATLLLSPHLFTYDLAVLLLPLWLMAAELLALPAAERRRQGSWALLLAALFVLPGISPGLAAATGVQLTVPLLLAFLWALSRRSSPEPRQKSSPTAILPLASAG